MDFIQKAKEAIMKAEHTCDVVIPRMSYDSIVRGGIKDVKVTAWFGKRLKNQREYTMDWDYEKQEFVNINPTPDLMKAFKREYNDYKISGMTEQELFDLLRKANRRRKSAERKAYKLRGKARRINNDALTAIGSRQRTIEEQWEVMRELQRRGLVSTEDLEKVLWDVMKVRRIKLKEE